MSDLVERLRLGFARGEISVWKILPEAADEIERLRHDIETMDANARIQAKLLADTARERDAALALVHAANASLAYDECASDLMRAISSTERRDV